MSTWREQTDGWQAVLDNGDAVLLTRNGHLRLGSGPLSPVLAWTGPDGSRSLADLELAFSGASIRAAADRAAGQTLTCRWQGPEWALEVRLTCYPELQVLRMDGALERRADAPAEVADARWEWTHPLPQNFSGRLRVHTLHGVRLEDQGGFPVSFLERFNVLGPRGKLRLSAEQEQAGIRPSSSNWWVPWFAVTDGQGRGVFAGIHWSGIWKAEAEWVPQQGDRPAHVRIAAGTAFSRTLGRDERLELPASFFGVFARDGLHEATERIHRYVRSAVAPPPPDERFPWVQFNSWYPWQANLNEAEMEEQLELAARLGVEVFVLDDGWFRGWDPKAGWGAGAGWWVADDAKFPSGLRAFGERVRATGMRFGLWIEPERVDPRVLKETGIQEAWLAGSEDNQPYLPTRSNAWQQPCFGCPETAAWAKAQLDRLIGEYGADWIKWDFNQYRVCRRSDHGHQSGDGNRAHHLGVYEVMEYVRRRYPHVALENCASGGSRLDYGVIRYAHVNWLSDIPSPSYRARSQFGGAVLAYPPEYHNAWVIPDPAEPLTEENARYKLRSCMLGAFGISYPLPGLPESVLRIIAEEIRNYKRLRPLITAGRFRRLLPQETSTASWGAYAYLRDNAGPDDGLHGAVLVFRGADSQVVAQTILIPGLEPERTYRLSDPQMGMLAEATGAQLAAEGLPVRLAKAGSSALIWIEA